MMPSSQFVARIDFLGTGNAFSPPGRMHALALLDGSVLVDTPPTALVQLRRVGISPANLKHLIYPLARRSHLRLPIHTAREEVHLGPRI